MSGDDAAKMLGIGRRKLYQLAQAGRIPVVKFGRATRFSVAALERFIVENEGPMHAPAPGARGGAA